MGHPWIPRPGLRAEWRARSGRRGATQAEAEPCGPRSPGPSLQSTRRPPPPLCDIRPRPVDPLRPEGVSRVALSVKLRTACRGMQHIHAFVQSSLHLDSHTGAGSAPETAPQECRSGAITRAVSRCSEEFTRRAVNSSHIRRDPVGVKSGCPGGRSRAPQGPPETYGRLPLWRVGCGESCGGRTGSDVARTAHGGVPRHKRPFGRAQREQVVRTAHMSCSV